MSNTTVSPSPVAERPKIRRGLSAVRLSDAKGSVHTYNEEEKEGLVDIVNDLLKGDKRLRDIIPINPKSNDIFDSVKDGVLLCKLVNAVRPGTIEISKINDKPELSIFEKSENLMAALQGTQIAINMPLVNIGVEDLLEGKYVLVLAVVYQLINLYLHTQVAQTAETVHLDYLLKDEVDASIDDEQLRILLRWFNHHLTSANHPRRVTNLGADIRDCENYIVLLHELSPKECTLDPLREPDLLQRATLFLAQVDQIGCKKFLGPADIVQGNSRLNFAFLANLFTTFQRPPTPPPEPEIRPVVTAQITPDRVVIKEEKEQIQILEEKRKIQDDIKIKEIQQLQKEIANAKELQNLPSVAELQVAIAKEERETKKIIEEKDRVQLRLTQLQTKVDASHVATKKAEEDYNKASQEVQKIEDEHAKEVNHLKMKLENGAAAVSSLKSRIDEAVAQATALTKTKKELVQTKDTLTQKIAVEEKETTRLSKARQKVDEELGKARKNLEVVQKNKVEVEVATTKIEKQLQEINDEIVDIKKETIRVEHSTSVLREDFEQEQEKSAIAKIEKKKLIHRRDELEEQLYESAQKLKEEEEKTAEVLQEEKTKGKKDLEKFVLQSDRELREYKYQKELKLANNIDVEAKVESARLQKTIATAQAQLQHKELREVSRELQDIKTDISQLEKRNSRLDIFLARTEQRVQHNKEHSAEEEKKLRELLNKEKEIAKIAAEASTENDILEHKTELLALEMERARIEADEANAKAIERQRDNRSLQVQLDVWREFPEESKRTRDRIQKFRDYDKDAKLSEEEEKLNKENQRLEKARVSALKERDEAMTNLKKQTEQVQKLKQENDSLLAKKEQHASTLSTIPKELASKLDDVLGKAKALLQETK